MSGVPSNRMARAGRGALVGLLLGGMTLVLWRGLDRESAHYDETEYIYAGHRIWRHGDLSVNPHPPLVKGLAGLGLVAAGAADVPDRGGDAVRVAWDPARSYLHRANDARRLLVAARAPMLLLWAAGGLALYLWSASLYGVTAGLFTLGLYVLCPNLLSQGRIVSTDLGLAACAALALFALHRAGGWRGHALAGILLGLALGSRHQGALVALAAAGWAVAAGRRRGAALMLAVALCVLAALYGVTRLPFYGQGLQMLWHDLREFQDPYLLGGEVSTRGWYGYFPVLLWYKLPPLHLLALLATLVSLLARRPSREEWLPLSAALLVFVPALASRINYGLRHVLVVLPLCYVLAGRLLAGGPRRSLRLAAAGLVLVVGAVELARIHPHQFAYVTPLAGEPGYRLLAGANLDDGQELPALARRLAGRECYLGFVGTADPVYYGIRFRILPGKWYPELLRDESARALFPPWIAVSATYLQTHSDGALRWLLDERPEAVIGRSILLYRRQPHWLAYLALLYAREGTGSAMAGYWFGRAAGHLQELPPGGYERARPWIERYLAARPRVRKSWRRCVALAGLEQGR